MNRKVSAAALACVIAANAALCLTWIGRFGFWFDEAACWRMSRFPWSEFLSRVRHENHPPLFFALLKVWTSLFGASLPAMRSLSAVMAEAALAGIYFFTVEAVRATDLKNKESAAALVGLGAAVLVAVWPEFNFWAINVRMYALGAALAAWSSFAMLRALRSPDGPPRWWGLYAALAMLLGYVHYFALFSVVAQFIFLGLVAWRRSGRNREGLFRSALGRHVLGAAAFVAAGWSPWLPSFLAQSAQVSASWWNPPLTAGDVLRLWSNSIYAGPPHAPWFAIPLALATAAVLAVVLREAGEAGLYLALACAVPFALGLAASLMGSDILLDKTLLFSRLFFLVSAALAVRLASRRPTRWLLGACLLSAVSVEAVADARLFPATSAPNYMEAAADYLRAHVGPEDAVVSPPVLYFPLLYFLKDGSRGLIYSSAGALSHYDGAAILDQGERVIGPAELERLRDRRVWIVSTLAYDGQYRVPLPAGRRAEGEARFGAIVVTPAALPE